MPLEVPTDLAHGCPRSVGMELDHLMLAIEAMNLEAVEALLAASQELGLEKWIPHRVGFWRLRNTNPLRKQYRRVTLQWEEAKALVAVVCRVAQQLNTALRFLVMTHQQVLEGKLESLGLQQNQAYLDFYTDRFRELYQARMRNKLSDRDGADLANYLLMQLLFASGTAGEQRLWHSLIDGAVE
ncbi:MAG: DUF3038 domain-containing protein [Cyanobacteria bacterium KgW148]|nr:DUF3038 domain-containing protein [Cyanobacteria bacterium KgW148]